MRFTKKKFASAVGDRLSARVTVAVTLTHRIAAGGMIAVVPGKGKPVLGLGERLYHFDLFFPGGKAIAASTAPADERKVAGVVADELNHVHAFEEITFAVFQRGLGVALFKLDH